MFRAADAGLMWVPVTLPAAEADGDDPVIWLRMRVFTRAELKAREQDALAHSAEPVADGALQTVADVRAIVDAAERIDAKDLAELQARVSDWRGVAGADDAPLDFDAGSLGALLALPWFFRTVRAALFKASRDGVAKNSLPGSAGTPARAQA
ncbi:hypothetical protein [Pseudoxanthomonas sp. USHLN014]|uniref:hypothetical protein n=1 Tax=Pseudoxanthomonas sp. USHLN014 TaxID=3081297 RepID=UPI00301D0914